MLRENKEIFVTQMGEQLKQSVGALFLDYTGLTVDEANNVRRKCQQVGLTYNVVKNTLMARVLTGTSYVDAATYLKGSPTSVVMSKDDPVQAAKLAFELAKELDHLKIKCGLLDGAVISVKDAEALSKMPSREELQCSVIGLAMSPARNLLGQVKDPGSQIAGAIGALIEKRTTEESNESS